MATTSNRPKPAAARAPRRHPAADAGQPATPHVADSPARQARRPVYDFARFEAHWREQWEQSGIYRPDLRTARRPYFNLMMFPYPSAEGLHVGNMYAYVGSDVHGRWQAMRGYDVFEPMGFDAFGIHSENFAIKQPSSPARGDGQQRRALSHTTAPHRQSL